MMWARVIYFGILLLGLGMCTQEAADGKRTGQQFMGNLFVFVLQVILLYIGGFFRW